MIKLKDIELSYPAKLRVFRVALLREYLQYKILEIIYNSKFANKLVFMGGTSLRIVYNNQRFSEDLDFDNLGLSMPEFKELSSIIKKKLELEGYIVEIRNVSRQTFHCYIKIPSLLYEEGLGSFQDQKLVIRIDTTPQNYVYEPETALLDKFEVYKRIKVVPLPLLLSQKFNAILNRKRAKGRDYFDVSYLFSLGIDLDMKYIKQKLNIGTQSELKEAVYSFLEGIDLVQLANDVEPFLFNPKQKERVIDFKELIAQKL